jgi:hypothetical protein
MDYDKLIEEQSPKIDYDSILNEYKNKRKIPEGFRALGDKPEDFNLTPIEKIAQSVPVKVLGDIGAGTMEGLSGAVRGVDWLGGAMSGRPQLPTEVENKQSTIANKLAEVISNQGQKSSEMGFEEGSIPKMVAQGLGHAAVSVPIMGVTGIAPYSFVTGAAEAKRKGGGGLKQLKEGTISGAVGFVQDKILGGIGKKQLNLIPRQLLGGTAMASIPIVEETARKIIEGQDPTKIDWKKVIADFIQGAVFPIGGKKQKEQAQQKVSEVPTGSKLEPLVAETPQIKPQDAPEPTIAKTIERIPDAVFIGMQENPGGEPIPLFNITKKGHSAEGSMVTPGTLEKYGLAIPEIPKSPEVTEPTRPSTGKDKAVSLEELARRQETVLDKNGNIVSIGKLGDEGVAKIYGTENKAYRPIAGKPGWEEFGKGPTQEVTNPKLIKKLNISKPQGDETVIPEYSTAEAPPEVITQTAKPIPVVEPKTALDKHAVDLERKAIDKGLLGESGKVSEHLVYNRPEQKRMSEELRNADLEQWKRYATGKDEIPYTKGADGVPLMGSSVFKDAMEWAAKNKDVQFVRELTKGNPQSISRAGQELNVLAESDPENPVVAIIDVNKTIEKANEVRKEKPRIAELEDRRLLTAQKELDAAMLKHEQELQRLSAIWQTKKTIRYENKLNKRGEKLTGKISESNYIDNPQYKTWLNRQTKGIKERVDRLSKTYKKLKEINDRRTTGVSDEEAQKVVELSDRVSQGKQSLESGGDRLEYGRAWVDFHEYVNDLKFRATKQTFREAIRQPGTLAVKAAGVSKAIKAAFDNSYIFRQGLKAAMRPATNKIWRDNAIKSFGWAWKQFGGKHVMREIMADIVSRPNYINGKATKAKLSFGNPEEPFPSALPESIPFFGKVYKASETAYAGQAYKTRMDIFDKMMEIGEKSNINLSDEKQLQSIGRLVNSMTGRGHIGKLEKNAELVNNVFFSLRYLKSNIDLLTMPVNPKETPFVRKQAAINLLSAAMGTAAILAIAKILKPDSVELDSRSSDFGKIKIVNTRFDVTGGASSLVVLASRLLQNSTKSATTGKINELGTDKFGSMTRKDVVYNFFEGKFSPIMGVATDLLNSRDKFTREKPTVWGTIKNLTFPMPVQNAEELLKDPKSAPFLIGIISDSLGIGTNTFGGKKNQIPFKLSGIDYENILNKTK